MNPLDQLFKTLRAAKRKAFMPFLTAGDPNLAATEVLLNELVQRGADLVEIGFPYSDPIADGPVIQASYTRALNAGLKIEQIFDAASTWTKSLWQTHSRVADRLEVRDQAGNLIGSFVPQTPLPLVAMVSFSIIQRRGPAVFLKLAQSAGFSGLIVPDLPVEESAELAKLTRDCDLKLIQLITPTTPRARAVQIAKQSTGFIYYVSVTGITGARDTLPPELREQLAWLRTQTNLPICVGFGISKPEHVALLKDVADGVIVGSAIVRKLENLGQRKLEGVAAEIGELVTTLRAALV